MQRIRTAFLKKQNKKQKLNCVLELVESCDGTYHLIENSVDWNTGQFKKIELFKSHNDLEEVENYYSACYLDRLKQKYTAAENGEVFDGLKAILDYTEMYINKKEEIPMVENIAEAPRLIRL
jgi:hypothetical protein